MCVINMFSALFQKQLTRFSNLWHKIVNECTIKRLINRLLTRQFNATIDGNPIKHNDTYPSTPVAMGLASSVTQNTETYSNSQICR